MRKTAPMRMLFAVCATIGFVATSASGNSPAAPSVPVVVSADISQGHTAKHGGAAVISPGGEPLPVAHMAVFDDSPAGHVWVLLPASTEDRDAPWSAAATMAAPVVLPAGASFTVRLLTYGFPHATGAVVRIRIRCSVPGGGEAIIAPIDRPVADGLSAIRADFKAPDECEHLAIEVGPVAGEGARPRKLGLQRVELRYRRPMPVQEFDDGSAVTMLAPAPDAWIDAANGGVVEWRTRGMADGDRVCIQAQYLVRDEPPVRSAWTDVTSWLPHNFPTGRGSSGVVRWRPADWQHPEDLDGLRLRIIHRTRAEVERVFEQIDADDVGGLATLLDRAPDLTSCLNQKGETPLDAARRHPDAAAELVAVFEARGAIDSDEVARQVDGLIRGAPLPSPRRVDLPGFQWLRREAFSAGGQTNSLDVYQHVRFAEALQLQPGTSHPAAEFVLVPGATFQMGSPYDEADRDPDEGPVHVEVIRPLLVSRTELTQAVWDAYRKAGATLSDSRSSTGPMLPLGGVTHAATTRFAELSGLRLPTEAEWEYLCRAGTGGPFAVELGSLDSIAWHRENSGPALHEVAELEPNAFGLFDTHGNLWEWCEGGYRPGYSATLDQANGYVIRRGGSYRAFSRYCRSANRVAKKDQAFSDTGFRLVLSVFDK